MDAESYKKKILELRQYTKKMSVLMAEDYLPLHDSLKKIFSSIFESVDSAYDGNEAIELYKKKIALGERYGIIFTDINMPNMNGIEFIKAIKKINKDDNVVVLSAYQDSKLLLSLINQGIRRYIVKPIELSNLLEELELIFFDIYDENKSKNILNLGKKIIYNKEQKSIYIDNQLILLTNYEQLIIELLLEKVNLAVSNDEIVNYLYLNMIDTQIDNIRKIMYKLRKKFPLNFIQSIHGIGYRILVDKGDN